MGSSTNDDWADWLGGSLREHERDRSSLGADRTRELPDAGPGDPSQRPSPNWADALEHPGRLGVPIPEIPRYEIREALGEGSTAVIYRAWDQELKRPVALKVLRSTHGLSTTGRERFRREAQVTAGLSHPNLVLVYDAGEAQGHPYLVMELVDGRPLSEVLRDPALDLRGRITLLLKAARGIAEAHRKGIVHRDLKPSNILVTTTGEPKVADFGLAHLLNAETELTKTGSTLGTPLYMSPEQVEGRAKEVTPRTDVYALGAILYEMASGHPPHPGETALEIYKSVVRDDPLPLRKIQPRISKDLETIAGKALARDPARRYASAGELAEDLERYLGGSPVLARPVTGLERLWQKAVRSRAVLGPSLAGIVLAAWALAALRGRQPQAGGLPVPGAPEYWVSPRGQDLNPGTRELPFREISRALEYGAAGTTIRIEDGLYRGGLTLRKSGTPEKPVTLAAVGQNAEIAPADGDTILVTNSSHIVLVGLRLFKARRAAIRIQVSDHITVRGCVLGDAQEASIWSGDSSDLSLDGNDCYGSAADGIKHFRAGRGLRITRNRIHGNREAGIELDGEMIGDRERIIRDVRIEQNQISENGVKGGAAINCGGVIESTIRNNLLTNNHATGIALFGREQGAGAPSKNNIVSNNTVTQAADGRWCINLIGEVGGNRVFNNILVTRHPARGSIKYFAPADLAGLVCDYNILTTNPHPVSTEDDRTLKTLSEWQALGFDAHSTVATAESLFVNLESAITTSEPGLLRLARESVNWPRRRPRPSTLSSWSGPRAPGWMRDATPSTFPQRPSPSVAESRDPSPVPRSPPEKLATRGSAVTASPARDEPIWGVPLHDGRRCPVRRSQRD
jgi:serine/threonine-protein kinase